MKTKCLLLFILLLSLSTCKKEAQNVLVDPELQKYVDQFFIEAKQRGISLDESNLEVVFKDIEDACGYGYSRYENTDLRRVEIDPTCWEGQLENWKEYLIFHELGHAVLRRSHLNSVMPNRMAKSIMCGTGFGYEECVRNNGGVPYSTYTPTLRDFYLKELFDATTPAPSWAKFKPRENGITLLQEDFESANDWKFRVTDSTLTNAYSSSIQLNEAENTKLATISSSDQRDDRVFSHWSTSIEPPNIAEGAVVELSTTVSTESIEGNGVSIVLRIDSGEGTDFEVAGFATTQNVITIDGTNTKRYSVAVPYYPTQVNKIRVYLLMLSDTKGTVSFDDVEVVVYE